MIFHSTYFNFLIYLNKIKLINYEKLFIKYNKDLRKIN